MNRNKQFELFETRQIFDSRGSGECFFVQNKNLFFGPGIRHKPNFLVKAGQMVTILPARHVQVANFLENLCKFGIRQEPVAHVHLAKVFSTKTGLENADEFGHVTFLVTVPDVLKHVENWLGSHFCGFFPNGLNV